MRAPSDCGGRRAFTLIELVVVIAIIAALIGILVPAMSRARGMSKFSACNSNLRQIAIAIQQYAMDHESNIPVGPDSALPYYPARKWNEWASNQVWIGSDQTANGLGVLLPGFLPGPDVLFCPGEDSDDVPDEKDKVVSRGTQDAFCSYLYRQLDQTTRASFDDLGKNDLGLPANALALDVNSGGFIVRTNHRAEKVNIVYRDTHAATATNDGRFFTLRDEDYAGFPVSVDRRLDEIICAADYAETGNPAETPPLP